MDNDTETQKETRAPSSVAKAPSLCQQISKVRFFRFAHARDATTDENL